MWYEHERSKILNTLEKDAHRIVWMIEEAAADHEMSEEELYEAIYIPSRILEAYKITLEYMKLASTYLD